MHASQEWLIEIQHCEIDNTSTTITMVRDLEDAMGPTLLCFPDYGAMRFNKEFCRYAKEI